MVTKVADNKGRISLGKDFADKIFIVKEVDGGILLTPASVIPDREIWLHRNVEAMASVQRGIEQARRMEFVDEIPDFAADAAEE